jgi:hypothetical protein
MSKIIQLKKPPATNDPLIRACVAYAQNVAAWGAGFEIDPTDSEYAEQMGEEFSKRLNADLQKMSALSATTLEGLVAKAAAVAVMMRHNEHCVLNESDKKLIVSLARNVQTVLDPIIEERWRAAKQAAPVKTEA